MAYVSVGQIENLSDTVTGLLRVHEQANELSNAKKLEVQQLIEAANKAYAAAHALFEEAVQAETDACNGVAEAEASYTAAESAFQAASSALSDCESGGFYDEDGVYIPPDCSCEELSCEKAEATLQGAETALETATQQYEQAKDIRMFHERQRDQLASCLQSAQNIGQNLIAQHEAGVKGIAEHVAVGKARLERASQALQEYLAANPQAAQFYEWLNWKPSSGNPVTPDIIHSRLNLPPEQLQLYFKYLTERDPAFREKIAGYREELKNAHGDVEKQAILLKIRRNLSGEFAERVVQKAFEPLGARVKTQRRKDFEDGSYTKTDIIIEGLKTPVILGKGKGMAAPKGGSIAIEVKCGKASYLYNQKDHMVYQAGGHQDADASIVICSRDIKDLSPEKEQELRDALREAGSPIAGMLSRKEEIDKVCWDEIQNDTAKKDKKKEKEHDED